MECFYHQDSHIFIKPGAQYYENITEKLLIKIDMTILSWSHSILPARNSLILWYVISNFSPRIRQKPLSLLIFFHPSAGKIRDFFITPMYIHKRSDEKILYSASFFAWTGQQFPIKKHAKGVHRQSKSRLSAKKNQTGKHTTASLACFLLYGNAVVPSHLSETPEEELLLHLI